jgi:CheY-like chemotaxis protein
MPHNQFNSLGHEMYACSTFETTLEVCQRTFYPLIMVDLNLPAVNGLKLCHRIRSLPQGDRSMILVIIGHEEPKDLRATLDASWQSPVWPDGYWPAPPDKLTEDMWSASVTGFFADLDEVMTLVQNPDLELNAQIPHGEGRTYLREVLLVTDHNAYHLGQIVQTRKLLGNWP